MDPVVVVDDDPSWPDEFSRLSERATSALGDLAADVEHLGSTAVPGLCAKPVIDMVIIVDSEHRADPELVALLRFRDRPLTEPALALGPSTPGLPDPSSAWRNRT